MKYTIRFAMIVALCTLVVLIAIPPMANAQTLQAQPTLKRVGPTPLPPPDCDLCDPTPKPPVCGWTWRGYVCSV